MPLKRTDAGSEPWLDAHKSGATTDTLGAMSSSADISSFFILYQLIVGLK
ncbi:hypothetical protein [Puniceibacterium sp. IMCC21224]|nr:hypothetical protein [Puniceibacterium sp. IMCC21224]